MMGESIGRVAVALLVVATIVAAGGVAPAAADDAGNESEHALEELQAGGEQPADSPPSVRVDGERMWWAEHWPADALGSQPGEIDDPGAEYLERGATVDRNSVWLRTVSVGDSSEHTLRIVYWEEQDGEATGIIEDSQEVSVSPGMPMIEVPLRESDEPRQVTMWLEDDPDVRWVFTHNSVATTADAGITTQGDYLTSVVWQFLLPITVGSAATGYGAKRAIERTGIGPGYPVSMWLMGLAIGVGVFVWTQFSTLAELLSVAPFVLAVGVIVAVGIIMLESQAVREREVLFFRPDARTVDAPDGSEAADALTGSMQEEIVVDLPTGTPAVVRKGIKPFVARWFGAAAVVPSVAFESRIKLGDSEWDELIIVDPDADTVLDYEPEGFEIDPPSIETRDDVLRLGSIGLAIVMVVAAVGTSLAWSWGLAAGALATLVVVLSPVNGEAEVEPADAHLRSAWVTSVTLATEADDARTLSQARQTLIEQQSRGEMEVQTALEEQDATLVESMLGSVDRSFGSGSASSTDADGESNPLDQIDEITERNPDAGVVSSDD